MNRGPEISERFDINDIRRIKLYPLSRTNFLTPWTGSHISCP